MRKLPRSGLMDCGEVVMNGAALSFRAAFLIFFTHLECERLPDEISILLHLQYCTVLRRFSKRALLGPIDFFQ
jgi:hypothetical protein